jgi:ABC-type polar amino acid transport system ATPase subunit
MSEGGEENVAGPSRLVVVGTSQSGKKTLVKGMMSYEDIIAGRPNEAGEVQASGKGELGQRGLHAESPAYWSSVQQARVGLTPRTLG